MDKHRYNLKARPNRRRGAIGFDADGNLVGGNISGLFRTSWAGDTVVWVPSLAFRAGLQFLSTGDLMVNNNFQGEVVRVTPDGTV